MRATRADGLLRAHDVASTSTIVTDLVVVNVSQDRIRQRRAVVSDYSSVPPPADPRFPNGSFAPKYNDPRGLPGNPHTDPSAPFYPLGLGPLEQFSTFLQGDVIDPCLYDPDGWDCAAHYTAFNPPPDPPGV